MFVQQNPLKLSIFKIMGRMSTVALNIRNLSSPYIQFSAIYHFFVLFSMANLSKEALR